MDKYMFSLLIVVIIITVATIAYCLLKHEKFKVMTIDSVGTIDSSDIIDIEKLAIKGNFGTEGQVVSSSGPGNAPKWKSGMTRFIANTNLSIPHDTKYSVGQALITMNLSNLTPGNKLIVNANCPVYCNPGYNYVQLIAKVETPGGTSMNLQFYTWVWSGLYLFTPTAEFIITSDPNAGTTQLLTISVNALGDATGVAQSPPIAVNYTCSVYEVS